MTLCSTQNILYLEDGCNFFPMPVVSCHLSHTIDSRTCTFASWEPITLARGPRLLVFTIRLHASAVFVVVCVCPSVSSRCSTETAKRRITQTTPHDSQETLVFGCRRSPQNSNGSPQWMRQVQVGWVKISDFRQITSSVGRLSHVSWSFSLIAPVSSWNWSALTQRDIL